MRIFLHECIYYGHVTRYAYGHSHICLRSRQLKQLLKLVDLLVKHSNTNMFAFDHKQFSKITIVRQVV